MQELKNGKMTIRVQETEFQGKTYIDVRNFYEDKAGDLQPTQKGVMVPIALADDLVAAIMAELDGKKLTVKKAVPVRTLAPARKTASARNAQRDEVKPIYFVTVGGYASRTNEHPRKIPEDHAFDRVGDAVEHSTDFTTDAKAFILKSTDYLMSKGMYKVAATTIAAVWTRGKWRKPAK